MEWLESGIKVGSTPKGNDFHAQHRDHVCVSEIHTEHHIQIENHFELRLEFQFS